MLQVKVTGKLQRSYTFTATSTMATRLCHVSLLISRMRSAKLTGQRQLCCKQAQAGCVERSRE